MYNQRICDLAPFDFLPYCGLLSPYNFGDWYRIDGYKDYLPTDTPIEDICSQIGEDFDKYVLPELSAVQSYEDFLNLRTQKLKRYDDITSHLEWLDICREQHYFTKCDAKELAIKAAKEELT